MITKFTDQRIDARIFGTKNQEELMEWTNGSIKGVNLPVEHRALDIHRDGEEYRAELTDWVVKIGDSFFVFSARDFHRLFQVS